jgi:hypothetical protein
LLPCAEHEGRYALHLRRDDCHALEAFARCNSEFTGDI